MRRSRASSFQNRNKLSHASSTGGQRATGVARALDFDRPSTSSFYGPRNSHQDNFQWGPGQSLPSPHLLPHQSYVAATDSPDVTRNRGSHNEGINEVVGLFRTFQNSLDSKLQTVCDKLSDIDSRITIIETRQKSLEEEVRQSISSRSSTASPASECDKRRKRVTPVVLQSRIRTVYNSFDEDFQFSLEEPITSDHNKEVMKKVMEAMDGQGYTSDLIKKGCQTYKKTLAARAKQNATPIKKQKLKRSLKQRAYERRARVVRPGKEASFWADITADMMSDKLNNFLIKLDERATKKGKSHARFVREQGSPRKQPIPHNAKAWMIKKKQVSDAENDETHSSEQQTHSTEQTHSSEQHPDHDKIDSERELFSSESGGELEDDTD